MFNSPFYRKRDRRNSPDDNLSEGGGRSSVASSSSTSRTAASSTTNRQIHSSTHVMSRSHHSATATTAMSSESRSFYSQNLVPLGSVTSTAPTAANHTPARMMMNFASVSEPDLDARTTDVDSVTDGRRSQTPAGGGFGFGAEMMQNRPNHQQSASFSNKESKRQRILFEDYSEGQQQQQGNPPKFIQPLHSKVIRDDDPLFLEVELEPSRCPSTFHWYLNSQPIPPADPRGFQIHRTEKSTTLTAGKATPGQYMIVAVNDIGRAVSEATVRFKDVSPTDSIGLPSTIGHMMLPLSDGPVAFPAPIVGEDEPMIAFAEEHFEDELDTLSYGFDSRPPKIVKGIRSYRVRPTDKITLYLEVDAVHPVQFRWYFEDVEIPAGDNGKYSVRKSQDATLLTIEGPLEGIYKVIAYNADGRVTNYGYVTVRDEEEPEETNVLVQQEQQWTKQSTERIRHQSRLPYAPRFIHEVPTLTIDEGEAVTIDVKVDAHPSPATFTWFCSGFELRNTPDGRLSISQPKPNHCRLHMLAPKEGEYKVVAQNSQGTATSIGRIIHEYRRPVLSPKPTSFNNINTSSASTSLFHQFKSIHHHHHHYQQIREQQIQEEEHHSADPILRVLRPPKILQGIGSFRLAGAVAGHHQKVTLSIEVDSSIPVQFHWYFNDILIPMGGHKYEIQSAGNRSFLTIDGLQEGTYKVTASNGDGVATSYGYVKIIEESLEQRTFVIESEEWYTKEYTEKIRVGPLPSPPIFVHSVPTLTVREGHPITLDVEVRSHPASQFTWFLNGFELRDIPARVHITQPQQNRARLYMTVAGDGEYRVTATNSVGSASSVGIVRVERSGATSIAGGGGYSSMTSSPVMSRRGFSAVSTPPRFPSLSPRPSPVLPRRSMTPQLQPPFATMPTISAAKKQPLPDLAAPPRFIAALPERMEVNSERDTLKLDVSVTAQPPAVFTWFINDRPLLYSERVKIITTNNNRSVLVIDGGLQFGEYRVTAKNSAGSAETSGRITVKPAPPRPAFVTAAQTHHKPLTVETYHQEEQLLEEKESSIVAREIISQAIITSSSSGRAVAAGGGMIGSTSRVSTPSRGSSRRSTPSRGGGSVSSRTGSPLPYPPRFTRELPSNQYVQDSSEAAEMTVIVETDAVPPVNDFTWFIGGFEVRPGRLVTIDNSTAINQSTATFRRPIKSGEYRVLARNAAGSAVSIGQVTVTEPPPPPPPTVLETTTNELVTEEWLITDKEERVQTGRPPKFVLSVPTKVDIETEQKNVTMRVQLDAYPAVYELQWYIMDRLVTPDGSPGVGIMNEGNKGAISITEASLKNLAVNGREIRCVATNKFGAATSIGHVRILEPTFSPSPPPPHPPLPQRPSESFLTTTEMEEIVIHKETEETWKKKDGGFPPRIIRDLKQEITVTGGENVQLILDFEVESVPPASFVWFLNGFELKSSKASTAEIRIDNTVENRSRLVLSGPRGVRQGQYRVVARNTKGTVSSSSDVITIIRYTRRTEQIQIVEEQQEYQQEESEEQQFKRNSTIKSPKSSRSISPLPYPPRFTIPLPDHTVVNKYDGLKMPVAVDALPEADFEWFMNGFEVRSNGRNTQIVQPNPNQSVAIFDDPKEGELKVIAANRVGKAVSTGRIKLEHPMIPTSQMTTSNTLVQEETLITEESELRRTGPPPKPKPNKPKFAKDLPLFTHVEESDDSDISLTVAVDTMDGIEFKWFMNQVEITSSTESIRFDTLVPPSTSRIHICPSGVTDGTVFRVIAWNEVGECRTQTTIKFKGKQRRKQHQSDKNESHPLITTEEHTTTTVVTEEEKEHYHRQQRQSLAPYYIQPMEPMTRVIRAADQTSSSNSITLEVIARAAPSPTFTWYTNGNPMVESNLVSITSTAIDECTVRSRMTLKFGGHSYESNNSHEYSVEARNQHGVAWSSTRVTPCLPSASPSPSPSPSPMMKRRQLPPIQSLPPTPPPKASPPRFIRELTDVHRVTEGDTVRLSVLATGTPLPSISWFAGGVQLRPSSSNDVIGIYTETIKNDQAGKEPAAQQQQQSTLTIAGVHNEHVISAKAQNIAGIAVSTATISLLAPEDREVVQSQVDEMKTVNEEEQERTEIYYFNERTETAVSESSAREKDHYPPRITRHLESSVVALGERKEYIVQVDALPDVHQFDWYIDDTELRPSPTVLITHGSNRSHLTITEVTMGMFGELKVVARNSEGMARSTAYITSEYPIVDEEPIASPPMFTVPLLSTSSSMTIKDGSEIKFTCRVLGEPMPEIKWYKDGVDVDTWVVNKDTFANATSDGWCQLYIAECFTEDSGEYTCVATNPSGTARTNATLNVEGYTYIPDSEEASLSVTTTQSRSYTHTSAMAPDIMTADYSSSARIQPAAPKPALPVFESEEESSMIEVSS